MFSFAGLYEVWKNPHGELVYSYTIITTKPNQLMAPIHERMPVALRESEESVWLDDHSQGD